MLHRDVFISHLFRFLFRLGKCPAQCLTHILLSPLNLDMSGQSFFRLENKTPGVYIHLIHQFNNQTVLFIHQCIKQVNLINLLISIFHGQTLAGLDGFQ